VRTLFAFALTLVLVSLQAALLHHLGGGAVSVAVALPVVVYLGLHGGNVEGPVGAAAVGYVIDLMAGGPKGLMTFLAVVLFLFSRLAGAALSVQGRLAFGVLSTIGSFLYGAAALGLTRAVSPAESAPGTALLGRVAVEALATGLVSPVVLSVLRRAEVLFDRDEPGLLR
jgi:hypothetical protein